jgi:hypothetical protein
MQKPIILKHVSFKNLSLTFLFLKCHVVGGHEKISGETHNPPGYPEMV